MTNTGLEEAQAGIKLAGRNINNLSTLMVGGDDTTLMTEEKLKRLLMKVGKRRVKKLA